MGVDSFKFLPRIIARFYQQTERRPDLPIPWTPLSKPLNQCKFCLVTSGGFYHLGKSHPFDLDRERREKIWGDPTFRRIPVNIQQDEIGVSHLHINPRDLLEDFNILFPIDRFKALIENGTLLAMAKYAYSFMGFQGFPPNTTEWENTHGPQVAGELLGQGVDCVFLTPA